MATFTDTKQRDWEIHIDAPRILKIREDCDANFMLNDFEDAQTNTFARLQKDPVLLCRVIYLLCDSQRQERGISEEDFYLHVIGEAIDSATDAMLKAIVNFTPRRTREMLEAFAEQEQMRQRMVERVVGKIRDPAMRQEVQTAMEEKIDAQVNDLVTRLSNVTSTPVT